MPGHTVIRWVRRLNLRGRLLFIGTSGLAIGLLAAGLLLVSLLNQVLLHALDTGARKSAADVVELVRADALPDPIPTAGAQYIQVLDEQHRIRAASIGADRLVPLLHPDELADALSGQVVVVGGDRLGITGQLRVVAMSAGDRTVVVGVPDRDVVGSVRTVSRGLLVAYPVLVGVLAMLTWHVVGWALAPVEALRQEAEAISVAPGARLPVPPGDDEVHRLAVTLNRMLGRLEAARERQRAFVADAAHELRSPIASLRTQLEVAEHLGEPPTPADLTAEVDRLGRLVNDLLLLARVDEGDPGLRRREPVELVELLRGAAAAVAGGRVPVTVADGPPIWALGDPLALRRVVDNLVANAVRHADAAVVLAADRTADRAVLTVVDDGPGIAPTDRARVFDRFTRLDDARARDSGGTGLGLAIVRELVRSHGGDITLGDARPGAAHPGLRMAIALPITVAD